MNEHRINRGPLITLVMIAYNQERYIREAVKSALAQHYEPLEIVLSDDCSTDNTFELMREMVSEYKGPHKVVLSKNAQNLNIGGHINTVGALASGELIVLAAGDDISLPQRVSTLVEHWHSAGRGTMALYSDFEAINVISQPVTLHGEGVYRGSFSIEDMARGNVRVLGATSAVTVNVFRSFLPMELDVRHEDRVLPFRSLLLGGRVLLVDEKIVRYRVDGGISRGFPESASDYLYRYLPESLARTLPDARQRLKDLEFFHPSNSRLRRQCLSTIADQEAKIELSQIRGITLEMSLLRWIKRGARVKLLFIHYLKCRFHWIFRIYYKIRHD